MPAIDLLGVHTGMKVPQSAVARAGNCVSVKYASNGTNARLCPDGNTLHVSGQYQPHVLNGLRKTLVDDTEPGFFRNVVASRKSRRANRKSRRASRKNQMGGKRKAKKSRKVRKSRKGRKGTKGRKH